MIRNDWTKEEIQEIYQSPLMELIFQAATVHREYQSTAEVQVCTLLSVKPVAVPKTVLTVRRPPGIIPV